MNVPELYGLVLAGGRSERMGHDKGLLNIHGVSQREYLFGLLSCVCPRVFTSCNIAQRIGSELNPIKDRYHAQGPLRGILSAFYSHPGKAFLVMAVDMPAIDELTLRLLIAGRDSSKMATCFYNTEKSWPEPLLTIWEPSAAVALTAFCVSNHSPKKFLSTHDVRQIIPPTTAIFQNVNTPDDLMKFGTLSAGKGATIHHF